MQLIISQYTALVKAKKNYCQRSQHVSSLKQPPHLHAVEEGLALASLKREANALPILRCHWHFIAGRLQGQQAVGRA